MSFLELLVIAIGLSMDAFAVSIGKGLSSGRKSLRNALVCGIWFGLFQALMPVAGYFAGISFSEFVQNADHWIAFGLLALIGGNMIREALSGEEEEHGSDFGFRTMLLMAVATSIDALACGVSFAFLGADIWTSAAVIGITTFLFSVAGCLFGEMAGSRFHKGAQIFGGVILILIGLKILLEHLGILNF